MLRQSSSGAATGFSRITGIAALGFALTIVLANVIMTPAGLPLTGAGIGEVNAFFGTEGEVVAVASALTPAAWLLATLFGAATLTPLVIDRTGPLGLLGLVGWLMWVVWIVAYGVTLIRLNRSRDPATSVPGADRPE
ncbi:hypothetical protein [Streptosporangium sp. V21-05]|uniref:hypothetical protein n=1 Tax=Streptosporangium sp. V21-05 TaxID=3446115 RepID=UPI003F53688B